MNSKSVPDPDPVVSSSLDNSCWDAFVSPFVEMVVHLRQRLFLSALRGVLKVFWSKHQLGGASGESGRRQPEASLQKLNSLHGKESPSIIKQQNKPTY